MGLKLRIELVGEGSSVKNVHSALNSCEEDCARLTKSVRELALYLVEEGYVRRNEMSTQLVRALAELESPLVRKAVKAFGEQGKEVG